MNLLLILLLCRFSPIDLKPYLRVRSRHDVVAVEAARVMCELHWLYEKDIVTAVATLQNFLSAGNQVTRFAAIKILSSLASKNPSIVSVCNVDIELLLTDSNRSIATLAVTTLLKVLLSSWAKLANYCLRQGQKTASIA
jgi:hypothetical protein